MPTTGHHTTQRNELELRLLNYIDELKNRLKTSRSETMGFCDEDGQYESGKEAAMEGIIEELEELIKTAK